MPVVLKKNAILPGSSLKGEIDARLVAGGSGSFFYVAPTRRRIRRLQEEFLARCPGDASGELHLFTLETLAECLCELLLPPRRILNSQLQSAFVQEAIRSRAADLRYFRLRGPARRLPRGTLRKITNVINRMKETGVYLSVLMEEIGEGDESEQLKLRDIYLIYETYEKLLGERYIDAPGLLKAANHAWTIPGSEEAFRKRYPEVDLLAVSGFDEFSDPELTLINALSGIRGISTVVTFDYHPDNDALFGHLKENYQKFLSMGFIKSEVSASRTPDFREHVTRHLFGSELADIRRFDARQEVTIIPSPDRFREAELIAKIIKLVVASEENLQPSRVCVSAPRPELYAPLFREVFEEAGIPANVTDRFQMDRSPLVSGLLALLAVVQNNFRTEDIMRVLSCPFFNFSTNRGPVDAGNIARTAADLKIAGGRKKWSERISRRLRFLRSPEAGEREGHGPARIAGDIRNLERAEADIRTLTELLHPFSAPMTPREFSGELTTLMNTLDVPGSIFTRNGPEGAGTERAGRTYAELTSFLGDLPEVLSVELQPGESRPLSWFLERFRPLLSQVRFNVRQKFGEGVLVTSIDETRGLSFDVMILAGLVDGEFPSLHEPEVFLPQRRREKRERYHLYEERYLFYQALTNHSRHLYLTYPLKDRGIDLGKSGFIESLEAVADVSVLGLQNDYNGIVSSGADVLETAGGVLSGSSGNNVQDFPGELELTGDMLDHLRDSMALERHRRYDSGGDRFRGYLGENLAGPASDMLKKHARGAFSVTQLETYGECPFRYFAERILRLNPKKEPEEALTPLELGSLIHEVLYEFYLGRRRKGLPPVSGLTDTEFASAVDDLRSLASGKFDASGSPDIFREVTRESMVGGGGRPGILEQMLMFERDSGVSAVPSYFEVRFGGAPGGRRYSDPDLSGHPPVKAGDISLRGKIDRIDMTEHAFRIVDYKTGSGVPGRKEIEEHRSLQLPLYLHCAAVILLDETGKKLDPGAGVYYHLRTPFTEKVGVGSTEHRGDLLNPGGRSRLFSTNGELRAHVDSAIATAGNYTSRIAGGQFPVEPRDPRTVCRSCDYARICRIRTRFVSGAEREGGPGSGTEEEVSQ